MTDDETAATAAFLEAVQKLETAFGLMSAGIEQLGAVMEQFDARLTRLEAAVIIQTGTVFGAQGDSDPMTIEHTIPERRQPLVRMSRDDIAARASAMLGAQCDVAIDDRGLGPELTLRLGAARCNVRLDGVGSDYAALEILVPSEDWFAAQFLSPMTAHMRSQMEARTTP